LLLCLSARGLGAVRLKGLASSGPRRSLGGGAALDGSRRPNATFAFAASSSCCRASLRPSASAAAAYFAASAVRAASQKGHSEQALEPGSEHDLPSGCMLIQTRGLGWSIQRRSSACSQ
jgi:hypothetical protein